MDIDQTGRNKELKVNQEREQTILGQTLIEYLPVAVYTCDKLGYITFYNRAAATLWGREPEVGRELWCGSWKLYSSTGEPLDIEGCPMSRTIKEGIAVEGELIIIERPDGTKINVRPYPVPTFDSEGQVSGAVNTLVNYDEIIKAEENETLLASIVNSSDDAIISKSLDGTITSWNQGAERIFGYTANEVLGRHISILIPASRIKEENVIISNIAKGKKVDHFETIRLTKDGRELSISLTVSPLMNKKGNIIGASKIARDITQIKIAEEKQGILAAIVETSDDAIISKTLNGIVTSWNLAAERMFGYTPSEMLGKHISLLIPADRRQEEDLIISNIVQGHKVDHFQTIRLAKDGTKIPISLTVSPVADRSGKVIGASKIARDISEHLKTQATNERLFKEIKALNEKKDEFIGIASHELKTPLTSISGYLQILDRFEKDDDSKKFLQKTIQQVNKLTGLVSDMLDVSKIEAGKLHYSKVNFDIRQMIDGVLELIEHTHADHEIVLETSIGSLYVHADEQRMEQVMINLITNAIKYSPNPAKISVFISSTGLEVTVGVKDSGFGIATDKLSHIFSRFYRVEDSNPTISGLGIGLYITSQIIERHQGKIWAESELGRGSTFWFSIPRLK